MSLNKHPTCEQKCFTVTRGSGIKKIFWNCLFESYSHVKDILEDKNFKHKVYTVYKMIPSTVPPVNITS